MDSRTANTGVDKGLITHRVPARMFEWNAEGAVESLADSEIGKPVEELISRHLNSARRAIPIRIKLLEL